MTNAELAVATVRPYWADLLGAEGFELAIQEDERWIRRGATEILGSLLFSARVLAGGHETGGLKELAEAEGADLIVVGSTHRGPVGRVFPGSVGERVRRHLDRALKRMPKSVTADARLLHGAPGHAILEAAGGTDLLIVGSRSHYGVARRLLLGSVAARVMRSAPCPTLITPAV